MQKGIKFITVKSELTEQELLMGVAKNDQKAIELIYKNNFPVIQSLILSNNGSYDDARDIFQ